MNVIYVLTDANGWLATVRDWGLAEITEENKE